MKTRKTWLAAVVTCAMLVGTAPAHERQPLRLMTYNIRLDLASDGINSWANRREWVVAQVLWLRPDIFGMQEVLPNQKADLTAALPQYRLFGGGRDVNDSGEASPIGFDTKQFDFEGGGMFWLSPTPEVPSKGWDAAYRRIVTWARLRIKGTPLRLLAVNTHWDHIGGVAIRSIRAGGHVQRFQARADRVADHWSPAHRSAGRRERIRGVLADDRRPHAIGSFSGAGRSERHALPLMKAHRSLDFGRPSPPLGRLNV